jgi:hypothetical protein
MCSESAKAPENKGYEGGENSSCVPVSGDEFESKKLLLPPWL